MSGDDRLTPFSPRHRSRPSVDGKIRPLQPNTSNRTSDRASDRQSENYPDSSYDHYSNAFSNDLRHGTADGASRGAIGDNRAEVGHSGNTNGANLSGGDIPGEEGDIKSNAQSGGSSRLSEAPGFAQSAAILIGMVLLSRVTGFFRGTLLAYYYGQNRMTDAYGYAFTIPDVLWQLVAGGAMYAAFVPVITEYFARDDEEGAWTTFSTVFTVLALALAIIVPLLWVFARPLLGIFAPDLSQPDPVHHSAIPGLWHVWLHGKLVPIYPMDLAVHLTRIVLPAQICFFLGSLLMGCQHSVKRFAIPSLGPVIYNVGLIIGGVIGHTVQGFFGGEANGYGISGFAWGALTGAIVGNVLLQIWGLRGLKPRFHPSLDIHHPGVKKCGKLVLPVVLGISLPQVDQVINGFYVSGLAGGRSILDYTNRLMQLPLGIFGQAIGMVILPTLSQYAAQKDIRKFKETISFGIRLALFLTVPAAALMVILAQPLIHVVYQHGNFNRQDTAAAVPALLLYAIGVPAWSAQAIIARAFYARQDTRTPVILGSLVTVFFFFLNGFLVNTLHLGVPGAALATTIAAALNCVLLYVVLCRRIRGLESASLTYSCRRTLFASLVMAGTSGVIHRAIGSFLGQSLGASLFDLVASSVVGLLAYVGIQHLLGGDELRRFMQMVKNRKSKPALP